MLDTPPADNGRATGMMGYRPLSYPKIEPGLIEIWNSFYKRRDRMSVLVSDQLLYLQPSWQKTIPDVPDAWIVSLKIDQQQAQLVVPASILNSLIEDLDPDLKFEALTPGQRAIIVEFALTDSLAQLENWLDCSISFVMLKRQDVIDYRYFEFECVFAVEMDSTGEVYCILKTSMEHLQKLIKGLDSLPGSNSINTIFSQVPIFAHLRWASIDLTYPELSSLGAGDIIFLDHYCHEAETAVLVIDDRLAARVKIEPDGYELLEEPGPLFENGLDWCAAEMPQKKSSNGFESNMVSFRAFVDYAQLQIPYEKFTMLRAGSELPAAQNRDSHLDFIVNGTRIGSGELTKLGSEIGFQILRI